MTRRDRAILSALTLLMLGALIVWIRKPGDFAGYLLVGELILEGRHPYRDAPPGVSTWPPVFSFLCVSLALLARPSVLLARGVWLVGNLAVLGLLLRELVRLVYQRPLRVVPAGEALGLTSGPVLMLLLLTHRPLVSNFEHLQVNLLIFALTLFGLSWLEQRRVLAGALTLGAAAALKVMPVLFVPYLAWRGRWRDAVAVAGATAAISLSPILVYGWTRYRDFVAAWREALQRGWGVGKMNQSVYAFLDRTIGHGWAPFSVPGTNTVPASGSTVVTVALLSALALAAVAALWAFRATPSPAQASRATLLEWSVVLLVSVLFGTVTWKAYLVVQLLPNLVLYAMWRDPALDSSSRRLAARTLWTTFVIGSLTAPDLIGRQLAWRLEMGSIVTMATLVQLAGCLTLRRRLGSSGQWTVDSGQRA